MGSLEADEVYALLKKKIGQGGGETSDYSDLNNLPQINGVELKGNKSTADLKINDVFLVGETTTFGQLLEAVENGQVCVRVKNGWFLYLFGAGLMSDGIIGSFWMNISTGSSDGETTAMQEYVLVTGGADDILVQGEETVVPLPEYEDISNYIKIFNPSSTIKEIFQNSSAPILLVIAVYDTGGDIRNIVTQITNLYSDIDGNYITLQWLDGDKIKYMQLEASSSTMIGDAMQSSKWVECSGVFYIEDGVTTFGEVSEANKSGKLIAMKLKDSYVGQPRDADPIIFVSTCSYIQGTGTSENSDFIVIFLRILPSESSPYLMIRSYSFNGKYNEVIQTASSNGNGFVQADTPIGSGDSPILVIDENTTFGDVATAVDAGKPVFLEGQLVQANKDGDSGASVGASMLQSVSDNQIISITGSFAGNLSEKVFDAEPNYGERVHYAPKSLRNSTLSYDTSTLKNLLDELDCNAGSPEGYEVYFYWYDDAANVRKLLSARIPSTHESITGTQATQTYGVCLQLNTGYGILQQTIKGAETDLLKDLIDFAKFTPIREPIFPTESDIYTKYILPGIFYDFGESEYLSIELESDGAENVLTNEYHFAFTSGSIPTNLVLPSTVKTDIVVEANMYYECSILNDKMVFREWAMGVGPL